MKFLLDQGLPRTSIEFLREEGIESEHVGELGMATASDAAILREGVVRNAIVVTLDADFHALLAASNASMPSVIRIRAEGLKGTEVAKLIKRVTDVAKDDLLAGAAITVSNNRIAVKRLPLIEIP